MIVLDTNVISELMRPSASPAVESWITNHPATSLFFSTVGEAELCFGLAIMPPGRRRDALASVIEAMLRDDFANRILPFDSEAARAYAVIAASRSVAGRPIADTDCQIAAITRSRGKALATRNIRDFEDVGIDILDPWTAS